MSLVIANISNRPVICEILNSENKLETLRVLVGEEKTIEDNQLNSYIQSLEEKGMLTITEVALEKLKKTSTTKSAE